MEKNTSWEKVENWYSSAVGKDGHYYHQNVILPGLAHLLNFSNFPEPGLLDLACGNGVLARHIPKNIPYVGVDASPSLIKAAQKNAFPKHTFITGDITKPLKLQQKDFSHAAVILAIQNVEHPQSVFANASQYLRKSGRLVIVMNHPCFRIPRQSSWGIDQDKKIQYRRIDRYSSPMSIPIQANPGKGEKSEATWSFHYPLASYSRWLYETGFSIDLIEEWHSDKQSTGKAAKMENRSRAEIPLFLCLAATKK